MKQFFCGNEAAWAHLKVRATDKCIRFRDQDMPPTCSPRRGHVAFETDAESGETKLLVAYGIEYRGKNGEVRRWFEAGERRFASFEEAREWVLNSLAPEYNQCGRSEKIGSTVTDIEAVHKGVREQDRPLLLDKEDILMRLKARVLGQRSALESLVGGVVRQLARKRPLRPASFLAVGPTGVGKTKSALELAEILNDVAGEGNGYQFLRLDMSEYQEAYRVSQLIGAPQGYAGHGDRSQLVDALRGNERTIVLFDEIEKAHPNILKVLMNVMDAGRLSSASASGGSHEIDCRKSIFIFTSNIESTGIVEELGSAGGFGNRAIEDEVCRRHLRAAGVAPEIVGRIGRFVVFRELGQDVRSEIMALTIGEVANEYGLDVARIEPEVIVDLMKGLRCQSFGIRPTHVLIDEALGEELASAAARGVIGPVRILGPPYRCEQCVLETG